MGAESQEATVKYSAKEILESVKVLEAAIAALPNADPAGIRPIRVLLDTVRDLAAEVVRLGRSRTGLDPVIVGKLVDKLLE